MSGSKTSDPMLSGKILVIDDNDLYRGTLKSLLEDLGYCVIQADNGMTGLHALDENSDVDLVFVDLIMPLVDGMAFIASAREKYPDLPIVVVSGVGDTDEAVRAIRLGAWDFISKLTTNPEVLQLTARRNIERSLMKKANDEYKAFLENLVKLRANQLDEALSRERSIEQSLRDKILLYQNIFQNFPAPMVLYEAQGRCVVDANQAFLDAVGMTRGEVAGRALDASGLLATPPPGPEDALRKAPRQARLVVHATLELPYGRQRVFLAVYSSDTLN